MMTKNEPKENNIPKCQTCKYWEAKGANAGYCNLISRSGEQEASKNNGAAAYDNFWTESWFYCALHSDIKRDANPTEQEFDFNE